MITRRLAVINGSKQVSFQVSLKASNGRICSKSDWKSFHAARSAIHIAILSNCVRTSGTSKVPHVDDRSRARFGKDEVGSSVSVM